MLIFISASFTVFGIYSFTILINTILSYLFLFSFLPLEIKSRRCVIISTICPYLYALVWSSLPLKYFGSYNLDHHVDVLYLSSAFGYCIYIWTDHSPIPEEWPQYTKTVTKDEKEIS